MTCDTTLFGADSGNKFGTCYDSTVKDYMVNNNICNADGKSNSLPTCSNIFHFAYENDKKDYIECGSIPNCSGTMHYYTNSSNTLYLNVSDNKLTIS